MADQVKVKVRLEMSNDMRKRVLCYDQVRLKPNCSVTEASLSLGIKDIATMGMILSSEQQRC